MNRWWTQLFGTGLVSTPEDFGTQGEDPTHPELLDWLSSELIDSQWSMKHAHKLIVMSEAFKGSARVTAESMEADPTNRLLSRGPRFRFPRKRSVTTHWRSAGSCQTRCSVRRSCLISRTISGVVSDAISQNGIAAENEDRFRRGVYVICKRAALYPSFINFDSPDRGSCTVNRGRSNTPLQALTLLNDPAYAEMALALADRILSESPSTDDQSRIAFAIELALARNGSTYEISLLQNLLDSERESLQQDKALIAARTKVPFRGMKLRTKDREELAAWFAVGNALLNLDETMSQ